MKNLRKKVLAVGLCVALTVNSTMTSFAAGAGGAGGAGGRRPGGAGGGAGIGGFFNGLDAFGNATATIGCVLNIGSVLANADWDDPGAVCLDLVDTIFGTSFGGDPLQESLDAIYGDVEEIKETTNDIKNSVDYLKQNSLYVNQQLAVVNGQLKYVNSQLNVQNQKLDEITKSLKSMNDEMTESFNSLNDVINEQTETFKSVVYSSTVEIEKSTELITALTNYVSNYSKLYTYDNNVLKSLSTMQDTYTAFFDEVKKLDNANEVIEALNKITFKEDSVDKLNKKDREILQNAYVTVGGKKQQVLKYHKDFVKSLMEFVAGTGDNSNSVFTLNGNVGNLGDTVLEMGDYLTANNQTFNALTGNRGIGEMYYVYCTYSFVDSMQVHQKYRSFMDSMIAQYMTTAWLAEMSYGYRIVAEANGDNNATVIRGYEQYLNDIHAQMVKVSSYYDYEYKKCINDYDFGGDAIGHDEDVIIYGNTRNEGVWNVKKKNTWMVPSGMSDPNLNLALGEEYSLHYYYRYGDVSRRSNIKWTSSNPEVVAVDNYGEILALSRGAATIKAEYAGIEAECLVSVGDVMAVANADGVNRYHYYTYESSGGNWVSDDSKCFEVKSAKGYDYYYGVNTYLSNKIELSESVRSASIIKTTGLTDENMEAFTWVSSGDGAVQLNGYEVSAVSDGWTEIIGYRKDDTNHCYDFIGIPVHSTMETLFKDKSKDYSTYTKISTKEDLIALTNNPDGWGANDKYVLTDDIDLDGMEWTPIGYSIGVGPYSAGATFAQSEFGLSIGGGTTTYASMSAYKPFCGTFDGNGHTISNFKITKIPRGEVIQQEYDKTFGKDAVVKEGDKPKELVESARDLSYLAVGLFGYVDGADICNLNVVDADINIDTTKPTGITLEGKDVGYDKTFTVFAGALAGTSHFDAIATKIANMILDYTEMKDASDEEIFALAKELYDEYEVPEYYMEFYEEFKKDTGNTNSPEQRFALMVMMSIVIDEALSEEVKFLNGCYATGNIKVNNTLSEGAAYAGMVSGLSDANFDSCTTLGTIDVIASKGACGGLNGYQYADSTSFIKNCITDVDITARGNIMSGGLIGGMMGRLNVGAETFKINANDTAQNAEYKIMGFELVYGLLCWTGEGTVGLVDIDNPNAEIMDNQVLGDIDSDGYAGGLIGYKTAGTKDKDYMQIWSLDMTDINKMSSTKIQYNVDICRNYVASNVTSKNGYAAGLLAYCDLYVEQPKEDDNKDNKEGENPEDEIEQAELVVSKGQIAKNYYVGEINAGTYGCAAGIIGMVAQDYSELKQNISAATRLIGGGVNKVAYVINGRENGMPLVGGTGEEWNVDGALCYTGIPDWAGDDWATKGDAAKFNDPETYKKILGDDNFLDLSGGLKNDGSTGLDIKEGIIPKKLVNRYRFPIEAVPNTYHQGEEFAAVTSVYKYTGTGTVLIKEGVTSTKPDMTKIGKQTVTLTYGDYTEDYDIYIYPNAGYLKVSSMPVVAKDGSKLSGGKVTLFENGSKTGKVVNISDCVVLREDDNIFTIKYGKYTTALRPVYVDVFANGEGGLAEYVGTEFYAQKANADVSALVPQKKEYNSKIYSLVGISQDTKFKAVNDVCILTYYGTDGANASKDKSKIASNSVIRAVISGLKNKTWTGKKIKQKLTVKLGGKTLKEGVDYTLTYKNNKNVGKATVTITGKGKYRDATVKTFKINPKKIKKLKSVKAGKGFITIKWKKLKKKMSKKRITGYQIYVSTSKKFKKAKKIKVKKYKKQSCKVKKLKSGKKYYVKIRTYMKVGKVTYYSAWSKVKKVKVK